MCELDVAVARLVGGREQAALKGVEPAAQLERGEGFPEARGGQGEVKEGGEGGGGGGEGVEPAAQLERGEGFPEGG